MSSADELINKTTEAAILITFATSSNEIWQKSDLIRAEEFKNQKTLVDNVSQLIAQHSVTLDELNAMSTDERLQWRRKQLAIVHAMIEVFNNFNAKDDEENGDEGEEKDDDEETISSEKNDEADEDYDDNEGKKQKSVLLTAKKRKRQPHE